MPKYPLVENQCIRNITVSDHVTGSSDPLFRVPIGSWPTHLDPSLFAAVSGKFNSYEYELQNAQMKVQVLEERLREQRIAKYGPGSEKLSNLQLDLLDMEPGVSNVEVVAESERETLP